MKKIISNLPEQNIVQFKDLPQFPIIGITVFHRKGWLQPDSFYSKNYRAICAYQGVSKGDCWDAVNGSLLDANSQDLENWFIWMQGNDDVTLFLFENEKELFLWLADQ